MKKNSTPKLFGLALTAALTLTALTACGSHAGTDTSQSPADSTNPVVQQADNGSVGTVLLSINPEIEIDYDTVGKDGKAVLISYTGYEGKPCTAVVGELVDEIHAAGYFDTTVGGHERNIVLKLERGSAYPTDHFLDDLATSVRIAVETDQIGSQAVTLGQDDYDDTYGDKGYINAAAAQNLVSAQVGRSDVQFVEKDYDLDDGDYEVEFILDGVEYEYEVDAYTGKVKEVDIDHRNDDRYDDDWDDRFDDDDWYGDPTGSDYPGDSDDWDDDDWDNRYDDDWDDRFDDDERDDDDDDDWDDRYDDDDGDDDDDDDWDD